jgi:hypothetical protein
MQAGAAESVVPVALLFQRAAERYEEGGSTVKWFVEGRVADTVCNTVCRLQGESSCCINCTILIGALNGGTCYTRITTCSPTAAFASATIHLNTVTSR